jgi:hypothetical protein
MQARISDFGLRPDAARHAVLLMANAVRGNCGQASKTQQVLAHVLETTWN